MRGCGVGSLHIAHISKAEGGDQKPFGSAFWHNGARATWFVRPAEAGNGKLVLALLNRKANLSSRVPPRGVAVTFDEGVTTFSRTDLRHIPELATSLPVRERIHGALRRGTLTKTALAEELDDVKADTLKKALMREMDAGRVLTLPGPDGQSRYGLAAERDSR